ncbi:calcium/calmodulin-dependent 3',5'-cyclic nucleotide phosphodiesterase 1-like [Ctenocephalides felis]|uniref:calcium/calmodulin-dependent 3',5'-cyclic nucleotide phosphodiesterase 1-like n=1 Tax=Ctenocephalides felis TaxID=7515 RepID=UPI000E6E400E|nr:calcium/calmodulin-dependent 3',5'-cyclic nucleotide phosphodiesterase 1-like [Ctenocephalides felis]
MSRDSKISRAMNFGRYRLVINSLRSRKKQRRQPDDDYDLSEVQTLEVPEEVKDWLAFTFTRQLASRMGAEENKPKFKTVAQAVRAGLLVDKIYDRLTLPPVNMKFPNEVTEMLKLSNEWDFDIFAFSQVANDHPIRYLGYDILNRYGLLHKFKIQRNTLEAFLNKIEEGYMKYDNLYHNNLHGADVAQTVHYMIYKTGLMNWLTDLEIFATLIAAIIHDYEHTGTTNHFHVMSGSDIALLYNDRAVLENHHVSASFQLFRDEQYNILSQLSKDEYREFRALVIDIVLATDMSHHFQQLKNIKSAMAIFANDPSAEIDKTKALSLVVHMCDISHPAKPWKLHYKWSDLLSEEFFRQGDLEYSLGLPYSPLCDRNNTLVAESQIGFIDYIVEPSMIVCAEMLESILKPLSDTCDESHEEKGFVIEKPWIAFIAENKSNWKERAAEEAALRAEQEKKLRELEETLDSIEMENEKVSE